MECKQPALVIVVEQMRRSEAIVGTSSVPSVLCSATTTWSA